MAMTINTNIVSINSQRNLSLSGNSLGTTMQRLSSGLRVNSAKDDAAGLAIAERMNAQSRGLAVAARNANDGISLAQTAEGALGKVGDMLQRMRELAVQASNATNSEDDRKALQAEVTQLTAEIDRVAKTTSFNNQKILDGSFAGGMFQVGASAGDNITVGGLGTATAKGLADVNYAATELEDIDVSTKATFGEVKALTDPTDPDSAVWTIKVGSDDAINLGALAKASSNEERLGQVTAAINAKTADTGVTAFLEKQEDGKYTLRLKSERVDVDSSTGAVTAQAVEFTGLDKVFAGVQADDATVDVDLGGLVAAGDLLDIADDASKLATDGKGIDTLDISTQAGAWVALKKIDSALDQVNESRGQLGALQTRFEKTIENIDIQNENITAARGRIVDADFATETANLSRAQILQQAGTAMVAQANQLPQQVLSLLQ